MSLPDGISNAPGSKQDVLEDLNQGRARRTDSVMSLNVLPTPIPGCFPKSVALGKRFQVVPQRVVVCRNLSSPKTRDHIIRIYGAQHPFSA